jgi:DNA-binding NtrC family response regulator
MSRVLVVDDEEPIRRALARALQQAGHESLEAENGLDALELMKKETVDLVVTDLVMPEVDGLELIKELAHARPGIKVIAISGGGVWDKQSLLTTAGMLGALVSLEKPFELKDFVAKVAEVLGPGPAR